MDNEIHFCMECGSKLVDGAAFCKECGSKVIHNESSKVEKSNHRKQEWAGKIIKCPSCGETLQSMLAVCPICGYEIRGRKTINSMQDFTNAMANCSFEEQKVALIKSFPVPSDKEDIFEFMIMAVSNAKNDMRDYPELAKAWMTKIDQCYDKAELLFENDSDFTKIQRLKEKAYDYEKTNIKTDNKNINKYVKYMLRYSAIIIGLILLLVALIVDKNNGNSIIIKLIGSLSITLNSIFLVINYPKLIDYIISFVVGILMLCISSGYDVVNVYEKIIGNKINNWFKYKAVVIVFGMVNIGIVITKIVDNHKKGKNLFE